MREKIELNDSFVNIVMKLSEGNMGAANVVTEMLNISPESFMLLLDLDDMNIRGTQIWLAYKDYCGESVELFVESVKKITGVLPKDVRFFCINKWAHIILLKYL